MKKLLSVILSLGVIASLGIFSRNTVEVTAEEADPAKLIQEYLEKVVNAEYEDVYNESFSVQMHLNDLDSYEKALFGVYHDAEAIQYKLYAEDEYSKLFHLYKDTERICDLKMQKQGDGSWALATVFNDQKDYILEVPVGMTVSVNGSEMKEQYLIESNVPASNFLGLSNTANAPKVNRYRINSMIEIPRVTSDGKECALMEDVTSNTIYVGTDATTDKDLANMIIQYAVTCAKFPAQEASVGAVGAISVTDSQWYRRVSGVQNNWFTSHGTSRFSNEDVLKIVKQSDTAAIANVVFDYYASNGSVDRTWNCGYQMTLINNGGVWKIAGMGIDSSLNPNAKKIK
ncbi:MAG: hypothetical protein IJI75_07030 [Solobacterium sp.]|nr:hypothetical protein [Solobacterium sp.]